MTITKEQQEAMLSNYVKKGHTTDECIGYIDGIEDMLNLVVKLDKQESTECIVKKSA